MTPQPQYKTTKIKGSQDHFWAYGVNIVKPNHEAVDDIKSAGFEPECFGSKVWQSNFLLMDLLSKLSLKRSLNVLEIGAGWGALSVFLSKHFNAQVIASDLDKNVKPFQQMLAKRNQASVGSQTIRINQITEQKLDHIDLIVASDICYDQQTKNELQILVEQVACRSDTVMLLADIGRKAFFKLSQDSNNLIDVDVNPHSIKQPMALDGYILSVNNIQELVC
ncbi:class I SAM-dependent methyltransferase [Catenovulum sp. 2E275]|uniref:class I SAM-dependent methyltransferase n=1 Tax=Catenovulum sp. 2E275 TaxID=2980497 RepID=UPI0021D3CAC2|nr:rRNA adenine N-6-methyltransferase family protein [Catenovulum sp. 2E275]MCU4674403.1 class I SAM-dependent methyltransferase [Catenovulum sp. 2E275]